MNARQRAIIKKLVACLPIFEGGEPLSTDNKAFMALYDLVIDEFQADYSQYMGHLNDVSYIAQAGVKECRALLNAACRSEYFSLGFDGSAWRHYQPTFVAALRRLDHLTKEG